MTTIALIGPDGAGKSSIAKLVARRLPVAARTVYMGVNLEASNQMLPTTRLALELKRRRGRRPDMVGVGGGHREDAGSRHPLALLRTGVRLGNWVAEEWFRQGIAWIHQRRGRVVVFDRHFFCDYYAADIAPSPSRRPWNRRVHGFVLDRFYPRPDMVILLDAPPEVLLARKGEGTLESLARMADDYRALESVVDRFVVVDATRDRDQVVDDVVAAAMAILPNGTTAPSAGASPRPSSVDAR